MEKRRGKKINRKEKEREKRRSRKRGTEKKKTRKKKEMLASELTLSPPPIPKPRHLIYIIYQASILTIGVGKSSTGHRAGNMRPAIAGTAWNRSYYQASIPTTGAARS